MIKSLIINDKLQNHYVDPIDITNLYVDFYVKNRHNVPLMSIFLRFLSMIKNLNFIRK
jgi:hypothetical protein